MALRRGESIAWKSNCSCGTVSDKTGVGNAESRATTGRIHTDFGLGSAGTKSGSGEVDIYSPSLSGHYHYPKLCLI